MLTARDTRSGRILALPDYEAAAEISKLRELTRAGILRCPACTESLWLRAGEHRCAHFAHRILADCPQTHVSMAILEAKRLLYRFFQERIRLGKLCGPIELEPAIPGLPGRMGVDLVLRRDSKPPVAVVLLEAGLKPESRRTLKSAIAQHECLFRAVFLSSSLRKPEGESDVSLMSSCSTQPSGP